MSAAWVCGGVFEWALIPTKRRVPCDGDALSDWQHSPWPNHWVNRLYVSYLLNCLSLAVSLDQLANSSTGTMDPWICCSIVWRWWHTIPVQSVREVFKSGQPNMLIEEWHCSSVCKRWFVFRQNNGRWRASFLRHLGAGCLRSSGGYWFKYFWPSKKNLHCFFLHCKNVFDPAKFFLIDPNIFAQLT